MYIWDSPSNYNDSTTYKINHLELVTTIALEKAHIFPMKKNHNHVKQKGYTSTNYKQKNQFNGTN